MEFKEMTAEELIARHAELMAEAEAADNMEDFQSRKAELDAIEAELDSRKALEAAKAEIRNAVARGDGEEIKTFETEERKTMTLEEVRSSKEYIDAFATYIKTEDADLAMRNLPEEARAALLTSNVSGQLPVPDYVEGRIRTAWSRLGLMDLVRKTYVRGNLKVGFELSADGAVVHTEGTTAPSDETLTFGVVQLTPASIKKWIKISDEAMDMGGQEFIDYIYDEITYQIAKKAQSELLVKIVACTASATASTAGVGVVAGTPSLGVVAQAIGTLSDEAANPVIVMNKGTWAQFKAAQYAGQYNIDPFEGLPVYFDNSLPAYTAGGTTGSTWMIVGDFGQGAQANFPSGDMITLKFDENSLAESDLVKIVGREYIGLGVVADKAFCKVTF